MAFLDTSKKRVSYEQFSRIYGDMVQYFRAKTSEMIDRQFYNRVFFYPVQALEGAMQKHIDISRPVPSNFPSPSDFANGCADWLKDNPKVREPLMVYDQHDDPDFDIRHLHSAFWIMQHYGAPEFREYCDKCRMPWGDRQRVICKARSVANKESDGRLMAVVDALTDGFDMAQVG